MSLFENEDWLIVFQSGIISKCNSKKISIIESDYQALKIFNGLGS